MATFLAENVLTLDDHFAETDADAKLDRRGGSILGTPFAHALLHDHRAQRRLHDATELGEHPIAGLLEDASAAIGDGRGDETVEQAGHFIVRGLLGGSDQAAVSHDIQGQNSGQPPLQACGELRVTHAAPHL